MYPPLPWFCSDTITNEVIGTVFLEIPQISVFSDSALGMALYRGLCEHLFSITTYLAVCLAWFSQSVHAHASTVCTVHATIHATVAAVIFFYPCTASRH